MSAYERVVDELKSNTFKNLEQGFVHENIVSERAVFQIVKTLDKKGIVRTCQIPM
jgi:hypothetical protein